MRKDNFRPYLKGNARGCAEGQLVQKMTDEWKAVDTRVKQQYPERRIRWDYLPVFTNAQTYNALLDRSVRELEAI